MSGPFVKEAEGPSRGGCLAGVVLVGSRCLTVPALLSTFETVMFSRLGGRPVELIYVPALRWAYAWPAGPVQMDYVVARIRERGWHVDRVGSARGFVGAPIVPPRAAAR